MSGARIRSPITVCSSTRARSATLSGPLRRNNSSGTPILPTSCSAAPTAISPTSARGSLSIWAMASAYRRTRSEWPRV